MSNAAVEYLRKLKVEYLGTQAKPGQDSHGDTIDSLLNPNYLIDLPGGAVRGGVKLNIKDDGPDAGFPPTTGMVLADVGGIYRTEWISKVSGDSYGFDGRGPFRRRAGTTETDREFAMQGRHSAMMGFDVGTVKVQEIQGVAWYWQLDRPDAFGYHPDTNVWERADTVVIETVADIERKGGKTGHPWYTAKGISMADATRETLNRIDRTIENGFQLPMYAVIKKEDLGLIPPGSVVNVPNVWGPSPIYGSPKIRVTVEQREKDPDVYEPEWHASSRSLKLKTLAGRYLGVKLDCIETVVPVEHNEHEFRRMYLIAKDAEVAPSGLWTSLQMDSGKIVFVQEPYEQFLEWWLENG